MSLKRRAILAAALTAFLASNAGAAEPPQSSGKEPYVVRVGYTAFKKPEKGLDASTLRSVRDYLGEIENQSRSDKSGRWHRPIHFEVTLGNYYQVWSWFKSGQIDAAVVSPFMAMLLERDSQALSILELAEGTGVEAAAHFPIVGATGRWRNAPLDGLGRYLEALLDAARTAEPDSQRDKIRQIRREFRLDLVSHLSSSGFIMPSLYVQEWLGRRKSLDEDVKNRFWHLFFENAHLTLVHGNDPAPLPVSTIRFSYEHSERKSKPGFGIWEHYQVGNVPKDVPSIPNDVLLVRRQIVEELAGTTVADPAQLDDVLRQIEGVFLSADIQKRFVDKNGLYKEIRLFNSAVQGQFRQEVSQLFSREVKTEELARLNTRWFEHGLFDFTIDETMAFLRQDQENSGISRLAVVLSGGGVKSLYQTVLLDHLYESDLRNADEEAMAASDSASTAPAPAESASTEIASAAPAPAETPTLPLVVRTVIGTSGGAMLAFFASQIPQVDSLQRIVEATSAKRLFPWADLPRLMSILALLFILLLVLLAAKAFNWWGYATLAEDPVRKTAILGIVLIALLVILAGAAAIVTTRSEYMESAPLAEALFFILTGVAAHFGVTCIARADGPRSPRRTALGRLAGLGLVFGVQLLVIAVVTRHWLAPTSEKLHKVSLPGLSVLASAGVFVIAAALVTGAAAGWGGFTVKGLRGYVAAMTAVLAATTAAFLPLIVLTALGWGTLLELTEIYWLGLVAAGLLAALGLLHLASRPHRRPTAFLREGFVELMRDRRGVITTSLTGTIVGMFAFCLACWGLLVTPAVYSNVAAVRAFNEALPEDQLWAGHFQSNLVVTGTLLRDTHCSTTDTVSAGGLYFCFEGSEGCGTPGGGQWQVFRKPAPARAIDAVFASGSAFPVFPPHLAHLPDGCEVRLVDGGYAHNVPLEAASMSEARQVLILNASPDPLDMDERPLPGWRRFLREAQLEGGQLIRSSPDVLSFMFARAQELDRNIGGSLVVASLTPRPQDGWWPFLLDFREGTRARMLEEASQDISQERRIGHVLSWGRPVVLP